MQQATMTSLDQAIEFVDEARRQIEVELAALGRLLHEGKIQVTDYTKRQAELREEKIKGLKTDVADVLAQTYTGTKMNQARYLKAAYDHLATGRAKLEAFSWKDAQLAAQLHSEEAYRQERNKEREEIQRQAQELTLEDLFPTQKASNA